MILLARPRSATIQASMTVVALLAPAAAWAADDATQTSEQIEVTGQTHAVATRVSSATKTDTPLIETPQSVSVVTRSFMDERQVQSIGEALRYTPGVTTDVYGADSRFDWLRIRGFDATTYGLYLDGMRFAPGSTGPVQEEYGLERIEVLDGPDSVLYGQASPGGLVQMQSKLPSATPVHELEFLSGSYGRQQGQADLGGAIPGTGGSLDGRVVLLVRDAGTQVDQVEDNRIYVAPSLAWHLSPSDDLTLLSSFQHDHTAGLQFLPAYGTVLPNPNGMLPTDLFAGSPDLNKWDRNQSSLGFLYEHRFDQDWNFRQSFRWLREDVDWAQVYGSGLLADDRTQTRIAFKEDFLSDLYTSDSRLTGHIFSGPVSQTVLAGLDYSRVDGDVGEGFALANTLDLYDPVYTPQAALPISTRIAETAAQTGLYLQDQAKLYRHVIVTVGARFDWANFDSATRRVASATAIDSDSSENVFSYRGGIGYLFDSGLLAYADYARSFEPTNSTNLYGEALKPTYGKQVEIGLKYQPKGLDSFVQTSLFDLRETNVATADPTNPLNTVQTGEIRVRGIENSATMSLGAGIDVVAAYTYLDPVITKANDGTEGKQPTLVPRNTASLWADYQFRDSGPLPMLAGFGLGGGVRYIDREAASNADIFYTPSVTLFDTAIHYDFGRLARWRLGINVDSLLDRIYVASCTGTTSCYYGQRRTVLGSIRVRW